MEVNREEAVRCLDLAIKARQEGNTGRAVKLTEKSLRLFPTTRAEKFLEELARGDSDKPRQPAADNTANGTADHTAVQPDPETLSEINRILSCKNLYDILNIPHDATQPDIKKQYRKFALKFHPDKCTAPRATDAFKAIGRSFSILSDPDKRRKYDVMGDETDNDMHRGGGGMHSQFFEEMDPFDLFASMFMSGDLGGGFIRNGRTFRNVRVNPRSGQRVYTYSTQHRHNNEPQEFNLGNILPLLPLLFLLLWSIFSNFIFTENSPYSFQQTNHYSLQRQLGETNSYVYYVHRDFEQEYNTLAEVKRVENSVLSDLLQYYGQRCQHDMALKRQRTYYTRLRGNTDDIREAENMATPGCSNLKELQALRSRG